jgi:DNA-binding HxlR family transcriptional regulator
MSNPDNKKTIPIAVRRRSPVPVDQCGAALAAEIISDRWTLLIIREAFYGVMRYDDMREDIGIPRSVLTDRLKKLVKAGVLERLPYREEGSRMRYGYGLTEIGKQLGLTILALMQWGDAHLKDGKAAIDVTRRDTGAKVRVGLVEEGKPSLSLSDVRIKVRP